MLKKRLCNDKQHTVQRTISILVIFVFNVQHFLKRKIFAFETIEKKKIDKFNKQYIGSDFSKKSRYAKLTDQALCVKNRHFDFVKSILSVCMCYTLCNKIPEIHYSNSQKHSNVLSIALTTFKRGKK